jgi:hypothetical protein
MPRPKNALKPFFSFYGSKWRSIPKYPEPKFQTIIEPFAGSATYSLHFPDRNIVLNDADPVIAGIWRFLIESKDAEIQKLPDYVEDVDDFPMCKEAKDLIGFWIHKAGTSPCKKITKWAQEHRNSGKCWVWGPEVKKRILDQKPYIGHWKVFNFSFPDNHCFVKNSADAYDPALAEMYEQGCTWFIDPPYSNSAGRKYKYSSKDIDFGELGRWIEWTPGVPTQYIVCEQEGASWLPFEFLSECNGTRKMSREVIYCNNDSRNTSPTAES